MFGTGYWQSITNRRVSRRRALAVSGMAALSTGILAACGGDGDTEPAGSGLLSVPKDTLSQAKRGGVMKDRIHAEPATMDISTANAPLNAFCSACYSSLVQFKPGYMRPSENEVIPDLVESWERSPDGLQITMKLRRGVKWHNKPPINGRDLDVDDVLFTWNRFATKHTARAHVANAADPSAPVISITASDSQTLVIKLTEPIVYALGLFASNFSQAMPIIPKETDSTFDIRNDLIGTGPFVLERYEPSIGAMLRRNPNHYNPDEALVDQVDLPFASEYATALSQFKAGNIYSMGSHTSATQVAGEDVLPVKQEEPRILIYQGPLRNAGSPVSRLGFGLLPDDKSPFLDERVRQAFSLAIERDLFLDTFFNISHFDSQGLSVDTRWNSHLAATEEGSWLDPKSKDFGPNAKYFQHDLAEGKKLLAAAGYANGFEVLSNYISGTELGNAPKQAEVMNGMIQELGITPKVNSIDYLKEYAPRFRDGQGQFEGYTFYSTAGGASTGSAIGAMANEYWSKSRTFSGFSATGKNDRAGDPQVDAMIAKARIEQDPDRLREQVFELQRYLAKPMYVLPMPGVASSFIMAWPCIGNFRVFQDARNNSFLWVDDTQPPIARS